MFEGWDNTPPQGYDIRINADNSFTILFHGEEVHTSRAFRLRVQAERKAIEWLKQEAQIVDNGVTIDVHNMSIDAETLFRR